MRTMPPDATPALEADPMFTWKDAPDLMARLATAQNLLTAPIDIMTFAGFCRSREELERHVLRYEARVAVS